MTNLNQYNLNRIQKSSKPNLYQKDGDPMAIVSGENIYIIYPNGTVSEIEKSLADSLTIKKILAKCDFWGDLATL